MSDDENVTLFVMLTPTLFVAQIRYPGARNEEGMEINWNPYDFSKVSTYQLDRNYAIDSPSVNFHGYETFLLLFSIFIFSCIKNRTPLWRECVLNPNDMRCFHISFS